jgi:DNA polymerase III delta prime subunit/MFS family permease
MTHLSPPQASIHPHRSLKVRTIAIAAWLWKLIWWLWSTVIVGGFIVSVIVSYATTGTSGFKDSDPRSWFIVRPLLAYPWQTAVGLFFALILTLGTYLAYRSQQRQLPAITNQLAPLPSQLNRQRLLAKVRAFWINGVLEQSLYGRALIALGLHEQPDAVANPWRLVFQQPNRSARPLAPSTCITQVYDDAIGELLILGEPGSGKTTLLLELARDLLNRAQQDDTHPIPVVFNLSSWAIKRQNLGNWLVEELNIRYQVPRALGQSLVDTEQLLLLFDGLDEVNTTYRTACIEVINAYRQEHGLVPIVICSRSFDYLALETRILLQSAVVVQPLTREQIEDYLTSAGEKLAGVRNIFYEDRVLQELSTTPLMLSMITLAYAGISIEKFSMTDSLETRRQQILDTYVQRMLSIRQVGPHYTQQQSLHWLGWLARQLVIHNQTEFYLERIQLDWLPKKLSYRIYPSIIAGLICGLCVALIYGFFFALYPINGPKLLLGLGYGSLIGLLNWCMFVLLNGVIFELFGNHDTIKQPEKVVIPSGGGRRQRLIIFLGARPVYGLIFGLLNGVLVGWLGTVNNVFYESLQGRVAYQGGLFSGGVYGLINFVFCTIYFALLGKLNIKIQPAEIVTWSWKNVRRNLGRNFVFGLLIGLIYGAILGALYNSWVRYISIGLGSGVCLVLIFSLISGLSHDLVSKQNIITPNQGIRSSF